MNIVERSLHRIESRGTLPCPAPELLVPAPESARRVPERGLADRRRISVCHILPALPAHGAEQLLVDLASHFDKERFDLSVILIRDEGPLAAEVRRLGIPVILLSARYRFDLSILWKIRSIVVANRIDVVHTHLITADIWGRLAVLGTKVRMVSTSHNVHINSGRIQGLLDHMLAYVTDAIVCVSSRVKASRRLVSHLPSNRLVVIENGIDLERMKSSATRSSARAALDLGPEVFAVGIVGRLTAAKNHALLFDAIETICHSGEGRNLVVLVVGEGELEAGLMEDAVRRGICAHVRFLGMRRDIPLILKALDLLVIPSTREGLPIVLLESMKARLPVIATRVGGIPDVIEDERSGILIDIEGASLARSIVRLRSDGSLRERLGAAAEASVLERFDVRHTADAYSRLYRSLVFQKGLSSPGRSLLRVLGRLPSSISGRGSPNGRSSSLRILMYHRVSDSVEPDILNTHPSAFCRHMEYLREEGYAVLGAREALEQMAAGSLPPKSVLITFDDGYRDNYTEVYPVLRRFGFPALIFPSTDFVLGNAAHPRYGGWTEKIEYLTPEQIGEMSENGIEFGSHGKSHAHLTKISLHDAESELRTSREYLERWTGKEVVFFAYPNGLYSSAHLRLIEKLGFRGAFTTHAGTNAKEASRFELCRTEVSGRDTLPDFSGKL
ncbi:MAG: glycosyltransferase, partial [Leptospirales bacterium]